MLLQDLVAFLDTTLDLAAVPDDKSNNGLQVAGRSEVTRVVGGVDGCLELYQRAAASGADLVFVHHGESWGPGFKRFTGLIGDRLGLLYRAEMSLYAAHLPLDAHPTLGHNARLAEMLGLRHRLPFARYCGVEIGVHGELPETMRAGELAARLDDLLGTETTVLAFDERPLRRIGVISGSGVGAWAECRALGLDALVTGDMGHTDYHVLKEQGAIVLIAGHYKTEYPGVLAVLDLLESEFGLETDFIDIPTGL